MTTLIRADALRQYIELITELGGNPDALLRRARIPPATVRARDTFVSFRSMVHLLEISASALGCRDFGIRLAGKQDPQIFGPLALAAQSCETLGAMAECFSRYFHTHNPGLQVSISQKALRRTTQVGFHLRLAKPPPHAQFDERCAALAHLCLKLASEDYCRPVRVLLAHDRISAPKVYRDYFDCEVRFGQPLTALEISTADMRRPMPAQNSQLHLVATAFLEKFGARPNALLSLRVRETIKSMLSTGSCGPEHIADVLLLHSRTLQRRLADEATSFEAIKDEVRREMAQNYLTTSALPLSQITALLGYSEQSALTRSCRRWFGCKPLALRQEFMRS